MEFQRAMVVFAHPDDAEFGSAGTVASWTRAGTEVRYVCVTDGSAGSNEPGIVREELAELREAEQRAACGVLGVEDCAFLGIPDGTVEVKIQALRCHKSQIHDWPVDDWIRERAHKRGEPAGMEFAEAFRTFKLREEER